MSKIGIVKEEKKNEYRISLIPEDISFIINYNKIKKNNIIVYYQKGAGEGAGYNDEEYLEKGCILCETIEEVYNKSDIIIKVKEPQESEYNLIRDDHTIMAFFHFAGNKKLEELMNKKKTKCIIYETIKDENNNYPILAPMSIIAGERGIMEADRYLNTEIEIRNKEEDIITIIGVGNVGKSSTRTAIKLGYKKINLIDKDYNKIKEFRDLINNEYNKELEISINEMNDNNLKELLKKSIITISSIYTKGEKADKLIDINLISSMIPKSIIIDIAIDQGGTTELSIPTTIENPYIKYKDICIYCVPNIPSTVPRYASEKLSNAIVNYYYNNITPLDI